MRRVTTHLKTLPPGYRERALKYHETIPGWRKMTNTVYGAIINGIQLRRTQEGYDFWCKVANWTRNPTKYELPILPPE